MQRNEFNLLDFPDELKMHILSFLGGDNKAMESIALTCKDLHNLANEIYFDTAFSRSLPFNRWLRSQINTLRQKAKTFSNNHQIGIVNRPADAPADFLKKNKIIFFIGFILANYLSVKNIKKQWEEENSLSALSLPITLLFMTNLLLPIVIYSFKRLAFEENRVYLHHPITPAMKGQALTIFQTHDYLISQADLANQIDALAPQSYANLTRLIDQKIDEFENRSIELSDFFASLLGKHKNNLKFQDFKDKPALASYARSTITFWDQLNKNKDKAQPLWEQQDVPLDFKKVV